MREFLRQVLDGIQASLNWLANSPWISFALIFSLSFAIHIQTLMKIPSRYLVPNPDWEMISIAISLMKTGQFADPYMIPTGPTAHLPPIYPAIFSLVYRIFGLTSKAGYMSMSLIILAASVVDGMLPWLSKKLGMGGQAGVIGGFTGAFFMELPGHGEYLTALALGICLVVFVQRWSGSKTTRFGSLFFGFGIGITFHLQPALLPVILGCMLFEFWWSKNQNKWRLSVLMSLGILIACIPWGWRNYRTFNAIFFIRSNLGLELRMGNHEGAYAAMDVMDAHEEHLHPRVHFTEAKKLQEIGEVAYMRGAMEDALEWIGLNPGEFLRLTGLRVLHIWFGPLHNPQKTTMTSALTLLAFLGFAFAWKKLSIPQRAILLIPLVTFPLIYYLVAYMPRYRVPIDWIFFMLAGSAIWHWIRKVSKDSKYVQNQRLQP
jgi:hypothetical protein